MDSTWIEKNSFNKTYQRLWLRNEFDPFLKKIITDYCIERRLFCLFSEIGKMWYFLSCFQGIKQLIRMSTVVIWTNWTQRSTKNGQNWSIVKVSFCTMTTHTSLATRRALKIAENYFPRTKIVIKNFFRHSQKQKYCFREFVFRNRKFIRDFLPEQPQKYVFLFSLKYCLK